MFDKKTETILSIKQEGLMAIVRTETSEEACMVAEACLAGGVVVIEISFTVPGALELIKELALRFQNRDIILGAGTVLDPATARMAILTGAQYIVTPYLNAETVKLCHAYGIPCIPGAMTIKEVADCLAAGADLIKIFPAELFGPAIIKAIKGPLPYAQLMPTGGVTLDNVGDWFKAGAMVVGVGGGLTSGVKNGDYTPVTIKAEQYVNKIRNIKGNTSKPT